jgi:hypothetical protein
MSNFQKNSFVSIAEQVALLNRNAIELLTKLQDVVASDASAVEVNLTDEAGIETTFNMPTVGFLKKEIDIANNNIKRLSQFQDKTTYMIDGESTKKVYQVDLNREPSSISKLDVVSQFVPINNWFFESLMNPLLSVEINLTDLVEDGVTKVLSRRYIVKFTKDADGNLTQKGQQALDDLRSIFLGRTDVDIYEFLDWYNNPTNTGVLNNDSNDTNDYDEEIFEFDYNQLTSYGLFTVLKQEKDSLNNKLWYHLNTLTYYDTDGNPKTLAIGDELILNKKDSTTRYKIHEVNIAASNYRVILERIEGYDPVVTGVNTLKYYSGIELDKKVKITLGFDEFNIIFLKPINGSNNVISSLWSKGTCFYSNDLKLNTDSNITLSEYYLDTVFDYGTLLKDLVKKNIPSDVGLTPNVPELNINNFKVVQINKHLTETEDVKEIKNLHSQKNQSKAKIEQIADAIILKTRELKTKQFKSIAERSQSENELSKLNNQFQTESKLLNSITKQITSNNTTNAKVDPKYRLRGFWDIPEARQVEGFRNQEIVQFKIQYRYSSKSGKENTTEGYDLVSNTTKTGYFSNWNPLTTDARKRYYDETTQEWKWQIEDVSDADTPNINQLDISMTAGEKVEIRIKSISEVGWPDAPIESDWSEIITIDFPDELSIVSSDDYILKEASDDELKIEFEGTLDAKGYTKHVGESFYVNEKYFAHSDDTIQTSFTDSTGNSLSLREYLVVITNKINSLEELVKRSKGEIQVLLFRNTDEVSISNGASITQVVECEDYGKRSGSTGRIYYNDVYLISSYYIRIDNIASENSLGLLSDRTFSLLSSTNGNSFYQTDHTAGLVNKDNIFYKQQDNQFIWISDFDGTRIYDNTGSRVGAYSSTPVSPAALFSQFINIGLNPALTGYTNGDGVSTGTRWDIIDGINWSDVSYAGGFLTTIHPLISDISDLKETGQEKTKFLAPSESFVLPINIYFKFQGNTNASTGDFSDASVTGNFTDHTKKLKIFIEPTNSNRPFEFTIQFKLRPYKKVNVTSGI